MADRIGRLAHESLWDHWSNFVSVSKIYGEYWYTYSDCMDVCGYVNDASHFIRLTHPRASLQLFFTRQATLDLSTSKKIAMIANRGGLKWKFPFAKAKSRRIWTLTSKAAARDRYQPCCIWSRSRFAISLYHATLHSCTNIHSTCSQCCSHLQIPHSALWTRLIKESILSMSERYSRR